MTPATAADVRDRIAAGRSDLLAATSRLVEIATENPPAAAYPECVSALVDLVEEAGLEAEVIELETPDGTPRAAVRSFVGKGPTLWFHGHYDVVPAQHAGQFSPDVRDGMLFGRGSADMKGGLAAMLLAARAIRDAGAPLNGAYCYGPGLLEVSHGPDEHVAVDALERCAEVYALTALDVLGA